MSISKMRAEFDRVRTEFRASRIYDVQGVVTRLEYAAIAAVSAENDQGGVARGIVAAVAKALDVDIDKGIGHRWDLEHMTRVVSAATQLRADREAWHKELTTHDHERAELRSAKADLSRRLREALDQRAAWKEALEKLDEEIVHPLRRELREEQEKNATLIAEQRTARAAAGRLSEVIAERDAYAAAYRAKPARMVFHTTAPVDVDQHADEMLGLTDDIAELKNVIVSQAREIARLKGESE